MMETLANSIPPLEEQCPLEKTERDPNYNGRWALKVFNNESASYDDIINVLIDVTGCLPQEAFIKTWEIDTYGHALVDFGSYESMAARASVIEDIADTDIVPEWIENED